MIRFYPPILRRDFIIVTHREKQDLCNAAISYLFEPGQYLPIFSFTEVDVPLGAPVTTPDIYAIQRRRAEHFSVFLNNAIIRNGGCENLILLGLNDNQMSYLDFVAHYNILKIDTTDDLDNFLGGFAIQKELILECSSEQSLDALIVAVKKNEKLKIGATNIDIGKHKFETSNGIAVIERGITSDVAIALNYALSIGAEIQFVDDVNESEGSEILHLLKELNDGDLNARGELENKINHQIGTVDFKQFQFATFFTSGLPYSLVIADIPISYVHMDYRPDFFIHNAIFYETGKRTGSAVVFSPTFFKDEETANLISLLEFKNFYLRKLIGDAANVYNLKSTIELYSFDLLHICSHGGDIGGTHCEVKFKDAQGTEHIIEFDHVLTVALTPFMDKHAVESIYYFKKFDGLAWRSKELHALDYSHELYASITPEISRAFDKKRVRRIQNLNRVTNANAIHCNGFNYLANFDQVGDAKCPPLIFNNACFSWMNVSTSFLVAGARGYIGTLMAVDNAGAVRFAEVFYDHVFDENIVDAVHTARTDVKKGVGDTNHIFWGLHFSTFNNVETVNANRQKEIKHLAEILAEWKIKEKEKYGDPELVKGKILDANWLLRNVIYAEEIGRVPLDFRQNKHKSAKK